MNWPIVAEESQAFWTNETYRLWSQTYDIFDKCAKVQWDNIVTIVSFRILMSKIKHILQNKDFLFISNVSSYGLVLSYILSVGWFGS